MKIIEVAPEDLTISNDLTRTGSAKAFSERLQASIEEIGLAEPIKVAPLPKGAIWLLTEVCAFKQFERFARRTPRASRRFPLTCMTTSSDSKSATSQISIKTCYQASLLNLSNIYTKPSTSRSSTLLATSASPPPHSVTTPA